MGSRVSRVIRSMFKCLWVKNMYPKWLALAGGKHGPKPAVCPSCSILSHTQIAHANRMSALILLFGVFRQKKQRTPKDGGAPIVCCFVASVKVRAHLARRQLSAMSVSDRALMQRLLQEAFGSGTFVDGEPPHVTTTPKHQPGKQLNS